MANVNRLGELLVREKLISLQQLRQAQDEQKRTGANLGATLAKLGYISDGEITNFLAQQYKVPSINLEEYEIDEQVKKLVSQEVCERHKVIPVSRSGNTLILAMADPSNLHAIDDIKFLTGYNVEPVVSAEGAIQKAIEKYYTAAPEISYDQIMEGFEEGEIEVGGDEEDVPARSRRVDADAGDLEFRQPREDPILEDRRGDDHGFGGECRQRARRVDAQAMEAQPLLGLGIVHDPDQLEAEPLHRAVRRLGGLAEGIECDTSHAGDG